MIFERCFRRIRLTASVSLGVMACAGGKSTRTAAASPELAHHLAEAVDQFVDVDGFRIRYREIGRGEPVVLLHGRSSSLDAWYWMADSLASDYRVVAIDFRGAGLSTKSGDPLKYGPAMGNDV